MAADTTSDAAPARVPNARPRPFSPLGVAVAAFALTFALAAAVHLSLPLIFDADSYFHLAVAREYGQRGIIDSLHWARFSAMHEGYGDKELLFHLLLAPFAAFMDPEVGGKLALALFTGVIAGSIAWLSHRPVGGWAVAVPIVMMASSGSLCLRLIRLRPELLGLIVLLWAAWAAIRRRYLLLAGLAFVYALAYTAFHALLGLCFGWMAWRLWSERRLDWRLLAYPILGALIALVVHPHFPENLHIWKIQSLDYFRYKSVLDVGQEIRPRSTLSVVALNWSWPLLALGLHWSRKRCAAPVEGAPAATVFWLTTIAFGALFVQMARFAIYLVPFATLGLLWQMHERGQRPGRLMSLPGGHRWPSAVLLLVFLAGGYSTYLNLRLNLEAHGITRGERRDELASLASVLPPGARVAASWQDAEKYVFWAPAARYLNLLDPVFMAVHDPVRHRTWRAVREGRSRDAALDVGLVLDSEYVAHEGNDAIDELLRGDPRFSTLHRHTETVYRLRSDRSQALLRDWTVIDGPATGRDYPRHPDPRGRQLEGFVDLRRLAVPPDCTRLRHTFQLGAPRRMLLELAPAGPSVLWVDGEQKLQLARRTPTHLGEGPAVSLALAPGQHTITLRTCPGTTPAGFYLLDRRAIPRL